MRKILLLAPAALAGCSAAMPVPPNPVPPPPVGQCTAEGLSFFVGQPATPELGARILRDSGASIFRWLPKGAIVTMEYNANRVNAHLDEQNRVERIVCG